jgi:nitric oxide reductase subunit B
MTGAFAVAGVAQVYLERRVGMDFLDVQEAIEVHFVGPGASGELFTVGICLFIYDFVRYGLPSQEQVGRSDDALVPAK